MKLKEEKGSITLFVIIAMFAFVLFSLATYTLLSRRSQTQTDLMSEIRNMYGNASEYDEYKSYFDGEIVPIYSAEELKKVGSGEKIAISKENGKIYTFSDTATYVLKNDIKLSSFWNEKLNSWTPIGTEEKPFKGFFEGLGHKISGLYIDGSNSNQGLFGVIDGGIVSNLEVEGKVKSSSENIGGIVGKAKNAYTIRNCLNRVEVTGKNNVGGIIGEDIVEESKGKILNCRNMAIITGESKVGGIIGISNGDIVNSVNFSNVEATLDSVGGLVGLKNKNESSNLTGTLKMSYNIAKVKGNSKVGGVVGTNNDIIENCYNTGIVEASNGYVGGIVGTQEGTTDSNKLLNSYSTGNIISTVEENVGGVIGSKTENSIVSKCIYIENTVKGGIAGENVKDSAEVRSAEFMKSKYCVYDLSEENWKTISGIDYPVLYWQDGEKTNLEFETVSTAQALKDMAHIVNDMGETFEGKTVTQQNDIDLSTVCSATLGNWEPIGDYSTNTNLYFAGTFEGNGNTISNLYINASENDYQGLFGYTNHATVTNLIIESIKILGRYNIGSIIGVDADSSRIYNTHIRSGELIGSGCVGGITGITNGNIIKCTNYSSVSSYSANVEEWAIGGISGGSYSLGKIEQCINYGTIVGLKYIGGIVGVNWCYTLNCYNVGTVKSNNTQNCIYIAGIVGYQNLENGKLENCYNIGKIEGNSNTDSISEIIGGYEKGIVNNCYYLDKNNNLKGIYYNDITNSWRQDVPGQAEVRSAEFMKSKYFVKELGEENWKIAPGVNDGYPVLSWLAGEKIEPEFETVSTAQALKDMAHIVNDMGETFEGKTVTQQNDIDLSTVCSATLGNWTPIGLINRPFAGIFNGNNYKVSNLYINDTETIWARGLFAACKGEILNLGVENINIASTNTQFVGGISGLMSENGKIEKCYSTGNISGNISYAGGISGGNYGATFSYTYTINECYSGVNIKSQSRTGGIIGDNTTGGTISNCYNFGEVESSDYVGGIAGINEGNIINCYNVANIIATSSRVGGITGALAGKVENSYNIGKVSGDVNYKGAIVGAGSGNGLGLDGIKNCYYLIGTSAQPSQGSTDIIGQAEAKTGTFMKSSEFVNLLGNSNWKLVAGANNGYPILSWQNGTPITVNNYDIYWNGVLSNPITSNEFTGWSYKGTVEFKENCITLTSSVINQLNEIRTTDKLNLTDYNTIVIRKTNVNLTRLYFVTGNLGMVNQEIIPFTFASKNAMNVGNDTWICDIRNENYEGWLGISSYSRDNDGDIYEMYLSTKTVEQIKAEYEN